MKKLLLLATLALGMAACSSDDEENTTPVPNPEPEDSIPAPGKTEDQLIVVCEGSYGKDNSSLAYIDAGTLTNDWYGAKNAGAKLGDTGNDIIQVNDTLLAVAVNATGLVRFIHPDGTAVGNTTLPQARKLATDGTYVYCTSYANGGYVAKIDISTKQVVSTCATGVNPEGVACAGGNLYVANTGSYSSYESTVSVVNATSMAETKKIETGCPNLYGDLSQSGDWLCISSAGNYFDIDAKTVLLNVATEEVRTFDFPAGYNTAYDGKFYIIGSAYDENWVSTYYTHTIDLTTLASSEGLGDYAAASDTIKQSMATPCSIYISPYTGHLYVGDAQGYSPTGSELREFGKDGAQLRKHTLTGINPGHIVALP